MAVSGNSFEEGLYIRLTDITYYHYEYVNETYFIFESRIEVWNNSPNQLKTGIRNGCQNTLNLTLANEISHDHIIHHDVARLMGHCATDSVQFPITLEAGEKTETIAGIGILIYANVSQLPANTYRFEFLSDLKDPQFNFGATMEVTDNSIEISFDDDSNWGSQTLENSTPATIDVVFWFVFALVILPILKNHRIMKSSFQ